MESEKSKICKNVVTTTLKMSIGYLQILTVFSTVESDDYICRFLYIVVNDRLM